MHTSTNGCNSRKTEVRLIHNNNSKTDQKDISYQISNRRLFAFGKFLQLFPVLLLSQSLQLQPPEPDKQETPSLVSS